MPEVYLALKTGSIDGQENPLTIMNAAKFYEVTEQVVLTAHLVQPVFFSVAKPFWDKLTPEQKKIVEAAAQNAAKGNDDARLADEKSVADGLKAQGPDRQHAGPRAVPQARRQDLCRVRSRQGSGISRC